MDFLNCNCSDVWGPNPVISKDGYRYYVSFIDHKTRYIWIYLMKLKYDVFIIFTQFKTHVEKFFQCQIKSVYFDKGEYNVLKPLLNKLGVQHLQTPSYTHEQNFIAER